MTDCVVTEASPSEMYCTSKIRKKTNNKVEGSGEMGAVDLVLMLPWFQGAVLC